ncbi:MAG: hypothetical protein JJU33_01855 [Phycisphaerales bacterium]|nr:hypothetical protein [Phycisphaerales bacterium]
MTETQGETEVIDHVPTIRDVLGALEKDGFDDHRWIDRAARMPWWVGVPVFARRLWLYQVTALLFIAYGIPWLMERFKLDLLWSYSDHFEVFLASFVILVPPAIAGYIGGRRAIGDGGFRRETRRRAIEHAAWTLWGGSMLVAMAGSTVLAPGDVSMPILMLAMFASMQIWMLNTINRKGTAICCASCGYALTLDGKPTCTECGKVWLRPDGLTQGRKFRKVWAIRAIGLIGIVFMISGSSIVGHLGVMVGPRWVMPSVPNDALISRVIRSPLSLGSAEFIELSRRELSEAQVERLAAALLDLERAPGRRAVSEVNWLLEQIEAGTLPGPLVERFEQSITRGEILRLLPRATVGFTLSPSVAITPRWEQMGRYDTLIAFAGMTYGIGEAPSVSDPGASPVGRAYEFVRVSNRPKFEAIFRAPAGGDLVVRAEWFVVLVLPGTPVPSLVWRDDNTIDPPADAVHIFRGSAEGVIPIVP